LSAVSTDFSKLEAISVSVSVRGNRPMSYKTIVVHLNDQRRVRHLLAPTVALARHFGAHLIGLHVFPSYHLTPPFALPVGASVIGTIRRQIQDETDRIKAAFDLQTGTEPFSAEWRSITTDRVEPATVVRTHVRTADLVVASQSDPTWDFSSILDFPERIALEGGRPVFVVPNGDWTPKIPPRTITIGWNGRREAARAVFDALPFLKQAEEVHVITVVDGDEQLHELPDAALADALGRHGVTATILKVGRKKSAAEQIRDHAHAHQSELLVLGAYGHSRFRELAFGGVTRDVLKRMTIPVLFSH
jgi:nucleotide-binding universal stress UspA family protein